MTKLQRSLNSLLIAATGLLPVALNAQMPDAATPTVGLSDKTVQVTVDYYSARGSIGLPDNPGIFAEHLESRKGDLWGGSLTYGHSATLYFDFSYYSGNSNYAFQETLTDPAAMGLYLVNRGNVDEKWFEGRVRWQPKRLAFEKIQAYASFGVSHIRTEDRIHSDTLLPSVPNLGLDNVLTMDGGARNTFANAGMGIGGIRPMERFNVGFKLELSLLGGQFKSDNTLFDPANTGNVVGTVSESKTVWGIISRGSVFLSIPIGKEDALAGAVTFEVGARNYYWRASGGSERNYGPFAKAGVAFYF